MYQIQPIGSDTPGIAERMLSITQASSGNSTAHRNGLLLAQAEQNISQPTVGSAHNRLIGTVFSNSHSSENGCEWVASAHGLGTPAIKAPTMAINHSAMPTAAPIAMEISGASSNAQAALDNTVCTSDTGNDFQNSTLRSRRSSYRLPSA